MIKQCVLKKKQQLTVDIYELVFNVGEEINAKPGQFITFLLDKIGGRAYSILKCEGNNIHLIIKKWELENGGRGGSKYLCEREEGDVLRWVGPAGHFVLSENDDNKLFLGTGTGFVPLYNQIMGALKQKQKGTLKLIFGVRTLRDVFYKEQLEKMREKYTNFDFEIFLSQEKAEGFQKGYITDFLTGDKVSSFDEYYLCGAPRMIDSAVDKLEALGVNKEKIYLEKY